MDIIIALVIAIAFSLVFSPALKKVPWLFYAIAVVLDVVCLTNVLFQAFPQFARVVFPYFQRGLLAYGLFVVIMFIGVLPKGSALRARLNPARGELSIFAAIITFEHIIAYAGSYLSRALSGFVGMPASQVVSFFIALIITILLVALTVTSFDHVRRAMDYRKWKALQKTAYAFFVLVWAHLVIVLIPSAGSITGKAFTSIVIYTVITVLYVVLRVARARIDARSKESAPEL